MSLFPVRLSVCFFLNIASMRWVTMKPPKMLTEASDHGEEAHDLAEAEVAPARPRSARRR